MYKKIWRLLAEKKGKKDSFCYRHYVMSVTEMFFTLLPQEILPQECGSQMWQKQLFENLVCNEFCYADEILELHVTVSQHNSFSLTAC